MSQAQHPALDDPNYWVPYRYQPSLGAAVAFAVLFAIATVWHSVTMVRKRSWFFIPFVIGGIFEIIGYIGRAVSAQDIWALGPYIVQSLLLLLAPALFAATIYMTLGRIIHRLNAGQHSLIPLRWLTKVFVTGDVISFLTQMGGGGIQAAGTLDLLHLGEKIIIAGLFVQVLFFGIFLVVAITFDVRYRRASRSTKSSENKQLAIAMLALHTTSGLIMVRSIFRVVEYIMGNNGFLLRHEYFLYIFDAALMFMVMIIFIVAHPTKSMERLGDEESEGSDDVLMDRRPRTHNTSNQPY